mmetsp:Transcript_25923/g.56870  ORF Transcript_25923/g.56870 Transcript_25923/m.56870 type:complete len:1062 (-) Transcript_25923:55-3240(-)
MANRSRSLIKGSVAGLESRSDSDQRAEGPRGPARPSVLNTRLQYDSRKQGVSPARAGREEHRPSSLERRFVEDREHRQSRIDSFVFGGNLEEKGWGMSRKAFVRSVYSNVRPQYWQAKREGEERTLKNVASLVLGSTRALLICQRVVAHWLEELHKQEECSEEVSEEEVEEEAIPEEDEEDDDEGLMDGEEAFEDGNGSDKAEAELDVIEQLRSKISSLARMAGESLELLKEAFKGHLSESLAMSQSVAAQLAATDESIQAVEREVMQARIRLQETFQAKAAEILSDFGDDFGEDMVKEWQVFDQHRDQVQRRRSWALIRTSSQGHQVDAQTRSSASSLSQLATRTASIELGTLSSLRVGTAGATSSAPPSASPQSRAQAKKDKLEKLQALFQEADEELCQNSLATLLAKTEEVASDTPPGTQIGFWSRLQQATADMRHVSSDLYVANEPREPSKEVQDIKDGPFEAEPPERESLPEEQASDEVETDLPSAVSPHESPVGVVEETPDAAALPLRVRQRSVQLSPAQAWKVGRRQTVSHEEEQPHSVESPRHRAQRLSVLATTSPVLMNFEPLQPAQPAGGKERQSTRRATSVGVTMEKPPRLQRGRWSVCGPQVQGAFHGAEKVARETSSEAMTAPDAAPEESRDPAESPRSSFQEGGFIIEEEQSSGEETQSAVELEEREESDSQGEEGLCRESWQEVSPRSNAMGLPRGRHHPPRKKEERDARRRLSFPSDALMVQQLSCSKRTVPTPAEQDRDSSVDAAASSSVDEEPVATTDLVAATGEVDEDVERVVEPSEDECEQAEEVLLAEGEVEDAIQIEQVSIQLETKVDDRKLIVKLGADWKMSERLRLSLQKPDTPGGWPELEAYRSQPKTLVCQNGAEVPLPIRTAAPGWTASSWLPQAALAVAAPPCVETVCSERLHLSRLMLDIDEAHAALPKPLNLPPLLLRPPPPLDGGKVKPHRPFGTLMAPEHRRAEPPPSISSEAPISSRSAAPRVTASPRHAKLESIATPNIKSARGLRTHKWRGGMATVEEIPKELMHPAKRPLHQRLLDAQNEELGNV